MYEDKGSRFLDNIVTHPQTTCCHTPKEHKLIIYAPAKNICTRPVQKVASHSKYLEKRSHCLDVTWQPVREDLTVHP